MKTFATISRFCFGGALFLAALLPFSSPPMTGGERLRGHEAALVAVPVPVVDDCPVKDPPPPVLKIKVRVPACAGLQQAIEYRICIENCSTAEAHHVVVKDLLPSNVRFV